MINLARKKKDKAVKILHDRYIDGDAKRKESLEKQLADLIGTTQSVISRLEDADYEGHSLSMVSRIAEALERKVKVQLVGKSQYE